MSTTIGREAIAGIGRGRLECQLRRQRRKRVRWFTGGGGRPATNTGGGGHEPVAAVGNKDRRRRLGSGAFRSGGADLFFHPASRRSSSAAGCSAETSSLCRSRHRDRQPELFRDVRQCRRFRRELALGLLRNLEDRPRMSAEWGGGAAGRSDESARPFRSRREPTWAGFPRPAVLRRRSCTGGSYGGGSSAGGSSLTGSSTGTSSAGGSSTRLVAGPRRHTERRRARSSRRSLRERTGDRRRDHPSCPNLRQVRLDAAPQDLVDQIVERRVRPAHPNRFRGEPSLLVRGCVVDRANVSSRTWRTR